MDIFKKNPRSYRLIAPFLSHNDLKRSPTEDNTPLDIIHQKQKKYIQLHNAIVLSEDRVAEVDVSQTVFLDIPNSISASCESGIHDIAISSNLCKDVAAIADITREADIKGLDISRSLPEVSVTVADIPEEDDIRQLDTCNSLLEDNVPEADIQISQTVLLDISNSISVSHNKLNNTAIGNDDNISVCSEIGNAYKNLMQLENCDFGSSYTHSVQLNTTNEFQEHVEEKIQENSSSISSTKTTTTVALMTNFQDENNPQNESMISVVLSPPTTTTAIVTNFHDEDYPKDPSIVTSFHDKDNPQNPSMFSVVLSPPTTTMAVTNFHCEDYSQNPAIVTNYHDKVNPNNSATTEPISNEFSSNGRPKKGRKRKYAEQTRNIRKRLCQTNKQYINNKGEVVQPREFVDVRCHDGCYKNIPTHEREAEFLKFWELSFEGKCLYVSTNVKVIPIKRKRNKMSNKRNNTRVYSLRNQTVCAKMFIDTLRISSARIDRYLKKSSAPEIIEDKRGKESGKQPLPQNIKQSIIDHIDKFPKYQSHYCRAQTNRMFLPPEMTLSKMYDLYLQDASPGESRGIISFSSYKKIFYTYFNLQRKRPQKDTCNKCDILAIKIKDARTQQDKIKYENERQLHHKEAEEARDFKKRDLTLAKTCDHLETLTFDMEKTLPLPRIPTNIVFYKRQLWLYNCGVHSGKTGKGFCYVWVEGTAGRGAQEVGSALRKHISSNLASKVKELILWSDSCGGQNRNIKITLLLFAILEENTNLEKITMRFMIPGHSFLENDSDFGDIESALKTHTRLYTPQDYMNVMTTCRKSNKLTAVKMEETDFVGVSQMLKNIVYRKKNIHGDAVSWLKTKEIVIYKDKPGRIYMSTTHGGQPQEVDINKRQRRGTTSNPLKLSTYYEQLWPEGKPISQPKLNDIKSLLHLIPSDARKYYEHLTGSNNITDDVEGYSGSVDFELEEF